MKVGFVARWNPLDKKAWSGISFYSYQQIKKYAEVEIFNFKLPGYLRERLTTQKSINRRFFKKQTAVEFLKAYSKYFSKQLQRELKKRPVDVLFVTASSQLIAYIKTDIPIIYMTDATFQQLQGYYPSFSNLARYNIKEGIELDKRAFHNATHCMLASDWNRNSAIQDYGIEDNKISVVPCGANLDIIPSASEINCNAQVRCNLLFLGVEWDRKGGDIALETVRNLKQKGINATLHIVGCVPPHDITGDEGVIVIPFLDKNNEDEFKKLNQLFLQIDFLLLPTRAECAGIVFCEASAYGIPSITTDTGGVTSYVLNGINGYTLPYDANAIDYADKIISIFKNPAEMQRMRIATRQRFEEVLNWEVWGFSFQSIIKQIFSDARNPRTHF